MIVDGTNGSSHHRGHSEPGSARHEKRRQKTEKRRSKFGDRDRRRRLTQPAKWIAIVGNTIVNDAAGETASVRNRTATLARLSARTSFGDAVPLSRDGSVKARRPDPDKFARIAIPPRRARVRPAQARRLASSSKRSRPPGFVRGRRAPNAMRAADAARAFGLRSTRRDLLTERRPTRPAGASCDGDVAAPPDLRRELRRSRAGPLAGMDDAYVATSGFACPRGRYSD